MCIKKTYRVGGALLGLLLGIMLLVSCTAPPEEMSRRESNREGQAGQENVSSNCDYVADAFYVNPEKSDGWFTVEVPSGIDDAPASIVPLTLRGQRMGVATYVHETVRYFMGAMTKLIFIMFGASGLGVIIRIAIVLTIIFWGLGIILGYTSEGSGYGLFLTVFKIAVILYFATNWTGFSQNVREVVEAVVDDFTSQVAVVFAPATKFEDVCHHDPTRAIKINGAYVPLSKNEIDRFLNGLKSVPATKKILDAVGVKEFPHSAYDKPGPFCIVDYTFSQFWNFKMVKVLLALIFSGFTGWIYGIVLVWAMIGYLFTMVSAMWIFLVAFIARSLLYGIAPLFIAFALFKQTRSLFDGWLQQLISFALQPLFLFAFLGLFHKMINEMLKVTLERIDIDTALNPQKWPYMGKSQTMVCYERFNPESDFPFYWWRFKVNQGSAGQVTVQGYDADQPINIFSILVVAILVQIMRNLTHWTVQAASSIAQGFLSAATVPMHYLPGGRKFSEDPDAPFRT